MPVPRKLVLAFVLCGLASLAQYNRAAGQLLITQVYGGGGSSSASSTYQRDYVELYNAGSTPASLSGLSLQYGSASGSAIATVFALDATATGAPGARYTLVTGTAGTGGAANPDPTGTGLGATNGTLNLAATAGKVALVNGTTAISPVTGSVSGANILDFVGYGNANGFEGAGPAPTLTASTADYRTFAAGVPVDTNNNNADFTALDAVQAPVPEPATVLAAATAGLGLAGFARRRFRG